MRPGGDAPLLEVRDLRRHYARGGGRLTRAVDGVSFALPAGGALALVGESGCGKSTLARVVAGLERPTSGQVLLRGRALHGLPPAARREVQMLFQDPYASLDPRLPVAATIAEGLAGLAPRPRERRVGGLLEDVGLAPADGARFPHELSGGMRQRVALARCLGAEPAALVADEPFSALDASVRAQVAALLDGLRRGRGLGLLLLGHDLALLRAVCDEAAVMLAGRMVETGPAAEVLSRPLHPYTQALVAAVLPADAARARALPPPPARAAGSAAPPASGCPFAPRCPLVHERCLAEDPALRAVGRGRRAACHLAAAE